MEEQTQKQSAPMQPQHFLLAGSVVVAGIIVALAIIITGGRGAGQGARADSGDTLLPPEVSGPPAGSISAMKPISPQDHIRGNPNAPVKIVEYSDFECPFCERFHPTMQRIVDEFDGQVAWVYRHFPLTTIHPRATGAAVASECVDELAGNDAFWAYTDGIYGGGELTPEYLENAAVALGIASTDFLECVERDDIFELVQEDLDNAIASGGTGTPYSIVVTDGGRQTPINGALPYEQVRSIVAGALDTL